MPEMTYKKAGVDIDRENLAIKALVAQLKETLSFRKGKIGESLVDIGHFGTLISISEDKALALGADGVGSKIMVAEMINKFDTIGIDLIAMNANDIICLGAEPLCLLDYIAACEPDPEILKEIGRGLKEGARQAGISIPGGELASLPDMVKGFDLAGVIVGIVDRDKIITGEGIMPGDAVIGLASSGIHSNGLTLARKVLLENFDINQRVFGNRTVGEELLSPTRIYVKEVLGIIKNVEVKGLTNITGGGLGNLCRITDRYGFYIDHLPKPQKVFTLIKELGGVSEEEMYRTFNMGIGFCIIVDEKDCEKTIEICREYDTPAFRIGKVIDGRGVNVMGRFTSMY